jgi:hypothetical protein
MTTNGLIKVFAELSDEALLKRFQSGSLTEEAEAIAKAEILSRGLLPRKPDAEGELSDASPSEDLVAIARGLLPVEAHVIRGLLEAEGIYAFVADEHLMNALPIWAHAAHGGGARVLVRQSHAQEAAAMLAARSHDEFQLDDAEQNEHKE